jgi:hypothetical protein
MIEQNCEKCRHVHQAGVREGKPALVCRRYPPQTQFLIVPRPAPMKINIATAGTTGGQMVPSEEQRSAFPAVMADWTCGEWAPAIVS